MNSQAAGQLGLFLNGTRESGADVRTSNVTAALAIANIVKSSLGPVGLDKMLVDDIGDVTITNDGATILAQLEVDHPAGRVLVDLAQLQDREVGDGTTSVPGIVQLLKAAIAYLKKEMIVQVSNLDDEHLINAAKTSMSSKILGKEADFFAKLAVDAVRSVKMKADASGTKFKYPLSAIHILKAHVEGGQVKIALLDMNLQRHRLAMGVQILVEDPEEIEKIKKREMDIVKERIDKILNAGAKVILTTKGVDDMCMKYFVEAGAICARRCDKDDLKRLAKATGGRVVTTMADMEGDESFDIENLGTCEAFREVRVGDGEMLYAYGCQGSGASTIVLRGANEYMLDEMDRALHDSLCMVKRMLESNTLVPGGGAVEVALSVYLENYATTLETREQLAIHEFAQALLVIPKTLAVNAAKDSSELVAQLRATHARSQKGEPELKWMGLDLIDGVIRDNLKAGVVEPAMSKIKSLRFATEAAITILRIDDRITLNAQR
ncbi:hypothetical protein MHU86_21056 [Fragilaria crotonensis]|nr:hypothetical protein MHU86_21056 [Fragilaria crotonensis]